MLGRDSRRSEPPIALVPNAGERRRLEHALIHLQSLSTQLRYPTKAESEDDAPLEPSERKLAQLSVTDDDAFIALVELDKRYAFTELACVRIMYWTAIVQISQYELPRSDAQRKKRKDRTRIVLRNLKRFGRAVTNSGKLKRVPLELFAHEFRVVFELVTEASERIEATRKANKASPTSVANGVVKSRQAAIAFKLGLHDSTLECLRSAKRQPAIVNAVVVELARRFDRTKSRILALYDDAVSLRLLTRVTAQ